MDISVIIPCYNSADSIRECIESIILDAANSQHNAEIIVVDDGSTDNTRRIIEEYKDRGVKYIYIENMGPATARNAGARISGGDILAFTDSDCIVRPGWINQLILPFLKNPLISAVKGSYKTRQQEIIARFCQLEFQERYRFLERQKFIDFVDTYSCAFKKECFWEVGGFDEKFPYPNNEDVDLSYRMASHNKLMVFNPDAVVIHKHKTTVIDYFKLKFSRAFWRMVVYNKYPEKIIKDSYTPYTLKIQMLLTSIFFGSLFISPFVPEAIYISLVSFSIFLISAVPFCIMGLKHSLSLFLVSFFMLFIRAISLTMGIIASLFPIDLEKLLNISLFITDTLTVIISVVLSYHISSFFIHGTLINEQMPLANYIYAIPAVWLLYIIILQSSSLYNISNRYLTVSYIFKVFTCSLVLVLSLASISYLFYLDYSRTVLVLLFPIVFIISLVFRMLWFRISGFFKKIGYGARRAVIVGINETSCHLAEKMTNFPNLGFRFVGFISTQNIQTEDRKKVIGKMENLPNIIRAYRINDVFFACPAIPTDKIFDIISKTSYDIISFKIVTSTFDVLIKPVDIESISSIPLIDLKNQPPSFFYNIFKRCFDLILACILLIAFSVFFILVYVLLVLLSIDRPIKKDRACGFNEANFDLFTFNTAPLEKKGLFSRALYMTLKSSNFEKFPMIFNVINGSMSFVGPAPMINEHPKLKKWQRIRFQAKPGITGFTQLMKKADLEHGLEYDFYYIRNRQLMLDFAILIKTMLYIIFKVL